MAQTLTDMDPCQRLCAHIRQLPALELSSPPAPRLRELDLSWASPQTLRLLERMPHALPPLPAALVPRSWWRHVYCLASVCAHLQPAAARHAVHAAVIACGVLPLIAVHEPALFLAARQQAAAGDLPLEHALSGQGLELTPLREALAQQWLSGLGEDPLPDQVDHPRCDPAISVLAGRWLLELKRMPSPVDPAAVAITPSQLAQLRLGSAGLVAAVAGLSEAVEDGRRLCRVVMDHRYRGWRP